MIIDSEGHCFYRACLSEMEPVTRTKIEEIMKKGNYWNEESKTFDEEIKIQFGPIYIQFAGQDRIEQSNFIYWSSKIIVQDSQSLPLGENSFINFEKLFTLKVIEDLHLDDGKKNMIYNCINLSKNMEGNSISSSAVSTNFTLM